MLNIFEMLGAGFSLVLGLMVLLSLIYFWKRNAGIVDIGWAFGFVFCAWVYFFLGDGAEFKKLVIFLMVNIWGLRLALHLTFRYLTAPEDPRYQEIRKEWGNGNSDFKFFIMFIFQGVLVVLLTLPFLIISNRGLSHWQAIEVFAILLWTVGFVGETIADRQLSKFKNNPENNGKIFQGGLWRYSRHPNYFFEFLIWLAYFFFALGTPGGWISFIAPAIMLCLLLKVSGIPLTEAELQRSKGAEFDNYCRTTSPFIPWFPKK